MHTAIRKLGKTSIGVILIAILLSGCQERITPENISSEANSSEAISKQHLGSGTKGEPGSRDLADLALNFFKLEGKEHAVCIEIINLGPETTYNAELLISFENAIYRNSLPPGERQRKSFNVGWVVGELPVNKPDYALVEYTKLYDTEPVSVYGNFTEDVDLSSEEAYSMAIDPVQDNSVIGLTSVDDLPTKETCL